MTLKSNALITSDEFLISVGKSRADYAVDVLAIYNSATDATTATVQITSTGIVLTVTGGTSAHTNTLLFATYTTISALITAIEALAKNWICNRYTSATQPTAGLFVIPSTNALLVANQQILIGFNAEYVDGLINNASQFITNYCNRNFVSASYTEYHDGLGENKLLLRNMPVTAFTSLQSWDYQTQSVLQTYTPNQEYEVYTEEGIIYMYSGFTRGHKNFKAVYTAGHAFADLPSDLKQACIDLCKLAITTNNAQGVASETIGRYSISYANATGSVFFMGVAIPPNTLSLLAPYRRLDLEGLY